MMTYTARREPSGDKRIDGDLRIRCSVCGCWNDRRRPSGGRYQVASDASGANGGAGATNTIQGCWFCMSPDWNRGAKAGDLIPPFKRR